MATADTPGSAEEPGPDNAGLSAALGTAGRIELVPRGEGGGYSDEEIRQRRAWVEEHTGTTLTHVGSSTTPGEEMRGNIENPIGTVQMPLGIAGPVLVDGEAARGSFYVPLATTEGALVRSYERGMVALTRAGGVTTRLLLDQNRICPTFYFSSVTAAVDFARDLPQHLDALTEQANATTRHGKLLGVEARPMGRRVVVTFRYDTGDAQGMNMICRATEAAARWLVAEGLAPEYRIFSGMSSEKRASGSLLAGGKGKTVVAAARLPKSVVRAYLHATPRQMEQLWADTVVGHLAAGTIGYNGHLANGLTALFIATGQDVANVVNSATGITRFEVTEDGDLDASVTLPSLSLATVGGGTGLATSRECLQLLGCFGSGGAHKLAEIAAATALAGELSFGAAIASGEFVNAHESYGRNRPGAAEA